MTGAWGWLGVVVLLVLGGVALVMDSWVGAVVMLVVAAVSAWRLLRTSSDAAP
jgi:hypothetical protein